MEGVANVHLDALEHGDTIAFMHSVQDGAARIYAVGAQLTMRAEY